MTLQMKYFVLKPNGKTDEATASRAAMRAYAQEMHHAGEHKLADEINKWADLEADAVDQEI